MSVLFTADGQYRPQVKTGTITVTASVGTGVVTFPQGDWNIAAMMVTDSRTPSASTPQQNAPSVRLQQGGSDVGATPANYVGVPVNDWGIGPGWQVSGNQAYTVEVTPLAGATGEYLVWFTLVAVNRRSSCGCKGR